ncbi:MAG: GNAT family N-acetyltransferase [Chloroflexia bacterium]|nr:GNAT family N-acetyltransferase [Chloroflexia bacterium]MDQ3513885.1 GNAT family N-acetyltransferase [Chloroflexota bacterium]
MEAPYLSTPRFVVRPSGTDDAGAAAAWLPLPFPIGRERGEATLREANAAPWGHQDPLDLLVCRRRDGVVLGAFRLTGVAGRTGTCRLTVGPAVAPDEGDAIRGDLIPVIIGWMRDELDLMTVGLWLPSDDDRSIAAAESAGMTSAVRLREHVARPGGRVDLLRYEILGRPWTVPAADDRPTGESRGEVRGDG